MSSGTKVFLAVVGLLLGAMVLYYTTSGDDTQPLEIEKPAGPPAMALTESSRAGAGRPGSGRPGSGATPPAVGRPSPASTERSGAVTPVPAGTDSARTGDRGSGAFPVRRPADRGPVRTGEPASKVAPEQDTQAAAPAAVSANTDPGPPTQRPESADTADRDGPAAGHVEPAPSRQEPAPAPSREHVVRPGDTLSGIAAQHLGSAVRWRLIARANPAIDPHRLRVGQVLQIPTASERARTPGRPAPPARGAPSGSSMHVVLAGETLSSIAGRAYGDETKWRRIFEANRRLLDNDPHRLKVGMKLVVP